jgi:hypothetical protein
LGDHTEAKSWFERSLDWMNQGRATDPELIRFREEASKTLAALRQTVPQAADPSR